jgi:hypothetical protein
VSLALLAACGADVRIENMPGTPEGAAGTSGEAGSGGEGPGVGSPASGLEVLYEGEDNPSAIALDDRYIYWASLDVLRRAPLEGGPPVTLATGRYLRGMVLDAGYVYFSQSAQGSGSIERVSRDGGEPEWLANVERPSGLALKDGSLFWLDSGASSNDGVLGRVVLDGSEPAVLATGLAEPGHLVEDGGYFYFASTGQFCSVGDEGAECIGGGIQRIPVAGGPIESFSDTDASSNLVFTEGGAYWLTTSPPRLMFATREGDEREVANVLDQGIGVGDFGSLHIDASALYWAADDKVLRMPFDGEVVRLASALDGASDVAIRGDWVYVVEGAAGRILRVARDGSANRPSGPITGPCPTPLGSPEELAATPRADADAERLALSLEPERITASQAAYERLASDLAAIHTLAPALADIRYRSGYSDREIYLALTDIGAQSHAADEYSAWDCLNQAYRVIPPGVNDVFGRSSMSIELGGIFNVALVAALYAELPEVTTAQPTGLVGGGSTVCVARAGDHYEYAVDRASGDCPSGCTEHEVHRFASDAAGQVSALDVWDSLSGEPAPAWVGEICD